MNLELNSAGYHNTNLYGMAYREQQMCVIME